MQTAVVVVALVAALLSLTLADPASGAKVMKRPVRDIAQEYIPAGDKQMLANPGSLVNSREADAAELAVACKVGCFASSMTILGPVVEACLKECDKIYPRELGSHIGKD